MAEKLGFGGGELDVGEDLAGRGEMAACVEEERGPGTCSNDGEAGEDGFGVGEENAGDGVRLCATVRGFVKEKFFDEPGFPLQFTQASLLARESELSDTLADDTNSAGGICPAAAPVDVAVGSVCTLCAGHDFLNCFSVD